MELELVTFKKDIHIVGLHTLLYLEHSKDFSFVGERHNFWELVYVDSGELLVAADNAGYTLKQGDIIFHKPKEFHAIVSSKNKPHNILVVTFTAEGDAMPFFENKIFAVTKEQKHFLSSLLKEASNGLGYVPYEVPHVEALRTNSLVFGAPQMVITYLEQFLILLMRDNQANAQTLRAKQNIGDVLVASVLEYLSDNLYAKITLSDVCKKFNLSKSYLCQLFKDITGTTIIDCYIDMKIVEAKLLIRQEALNYTQIAEALGYTSIHHFTRSFKARTGLSPSDYKKSIV